MRDSAWFVLAGAAMFLLGLPYLAAACWLLAWWWEARGL